MKRIKKKSFWLTLFFVQNKHHAHGVLLHTLKLFWFALKDGQYRMLTAALLHDIGKPYMAFQDDEDRLTGEYSFHNHEEASYHIVKNWPFISDYTKSMIRYHYLIRGMIKAKRKNQIGKYNRQKRHWDSLNEEMKKDLALFLKFDDLVKGK